MIAKLLIEHIEQKTNEQEVAVLLSGGVDSISVAFAAHLAFKKIRCYSFQLDNNPSYDFKKAEEICKIMKWPFVGVNVPVANLEDDFKRLLKHGCQKKTHFECVYPFLYVYEWISEKYVLSGWAADGYYGVSKKACMHFKEPKSLFDQFRNDYFKKENRAGYLQHKKLADKHNKVFVTPYLDKEVKKYFYQYDWYQLNKPYQKHMVRDAFKSYFNRIGKVKNHLNLQLDSGIANLFETLLNNNKINFNKRNRMLEVYKDWKVCYNGDTSLENFFV